METRSMRSRQKIEENDTTNIQTKKKSIKRKADLEIPELDLPEICLPEIDVPLNSNQVEEATDKPKKRKTKNASPVSSEMHLTDRSTENSSINNSSGVVIKPKFKTKAIQAEYVSSKLEVLKNIFSQNLTNPSESIVKIRMTLDELNSHNNKSSMFLENKW